MSEVVSRASAEPQMVEAGRPVNAEGRTADAISAAGAKRAEVEDLVRQIAMDIGKEVVAYVEVMYPQFRTAADAAIVQAESSPTAFKNLENFSNMRFLAKSCLDP